LPIIDIGRVVFDIIVSFLSAYANVALVTIVSGIAVFPDVVEVSFCPVIVAFIPSGVIAPSCTIDNKVMDILY
jgi:hypothetical protein